jgi:hypothetical protein
VEVNSTTGYKIAMSFFTNCSFYWAVMLSVRGVFQKNPKFRFDQNSKGVTDSKLTNLQQQQPGEQQ